MDGRERKDRMAWDFEDGWKVEGEEEKRKIGRKGLLERNNHDVVIQTNANSQKGGHSKWR